MKAHQDSIAKETIPNHEHTKTHHAQPRHPSEAGASDLAQELTNPVADLITLPIQANFDFNLGSLDEGFKLQVNVQPVIPFDLNDDWNLISRTILPIVEQQDVPFLGSYDFGLGDTVQSFFFSPKAATDSG